MPDELATVPLRRRAPSDARVDATAAWSEMNRTSALAIDTATTNDGPRPVCACATTVLQTGRRPERRPGETRNRAPRGRGDPLPRLRPRRPRPNVLGASIYNQSKSRHHLRRSSHRVGRGSEKPAFGPYL
ncbi:hypothetical protein THAOC_29546 [Thalassiosira oceanica]|uniref:Uncharacterized protein n=1 Tax=Thalassiosira oceanica TaxID=159749 RepID=K0RG74_THAOC|nr:hypothetical protein THAOC_29546 [Thalassiosira oceanica]|eukprot:EJK51294.1 hypothetical protein THAOC_29546 [Thalassiosira oceanica]